MRHGKNIIVKPHFDGQVADIVVVGGGPAGLGLVDALQKVLGNSQKILLLEKTDQFGGNAWASLQHFRTYQGHKDLSDAVAKTLEWYQKFSSNRRFPYVFIAKTRQKLVSFSNNLKQVNRWGYGKNAEILDAHQVYNRYQMIDEPIAGALVYPDAGWLDFKKGSEWIISHARNSIFCLETSLLDIEVSRGKVVGVKTNRGKINTDTVICTLGPFILKMKNYIKDNELNNLLKNICVQKRQSFTSKLADLPPQSEGFFITQDGAYVRMIIGKDGMGVGRYGYADSSDPCLERPQINPKPDEDKFSKKVYDQLSTIISRYNGVGLQKSLAAKPSHAMAGYYVQTKDDMPIVSATNINGLYILGALSHLGIMTHIGLAQRMTDIISKPQKMENNPFSLYRNQDEHRGIVL